VLIAFSSISARAQSFEVASIKPNKEDSSRSNLDLQPGGRFTATNVSLMALVNLSYGDNGFPLGPARLVMNEKGISGIALGGPGGGYQSSDRFDIVAKTNGEFTRDQLLAAIRQLLADRFKLVVHHELKELTSYHLMLARADGRLGPKLKRSDVDCSDLNAPAAKNDDGTSKCGFRRLPGKATGRATMKDFAERFAASAVDDRRPVENHTGLDDTFDFDIEWTPVLPIPADGPPAPPVDPQGPPLFTALREQLGLKLEPAKQQIDIVVVDHAERPTEN
jgi:uncharacterized protein (TIGR03435 family)